MTFFSFEHSELALKKAFNTVDHSILLKKLILLNILLKILLKEFQMNGLHPGLILENKGMRAV